MNKCCVWMECIWIGPAVCAYWMVHYGLLSYRILSLAMVRQAPPMKKREDGSSDRIRPSSDRAAAAERNSSLRSSLFAIPHSLRCASSQRPRNASRSCPRDIFRHFEFDHDDCIKQLWKGAQASGRCSRNCASCFCNKTTA